MKRLFTLLISILIGFTTFSQNQDIEILVDYDEGYNFAPLNSFTFVEENFTADTEPRTLAIYSMVKNSVLYEMDVRGVELDDVEPDFLVNYEVFGNFEGEMQADADDDPPFRYMLGDEDLTMEEVLTEGTIVISIVDAKTGEPVWEGYAINVVDFEVENLRKVQVSIRKAVNRVINELDHVMDGGNSE
jgi:hypothetical protein